MNSIFDGNFGIPVVSIFVKHGRARLFFSLHALRDLIIDRIAVLEISPMFHNFLTINSSHSSHTILNDTLLNKLLLDDKWRWPAWNRPTAYLLDCAHAMRHAPLPAPRKP